VVAKLAGYRDRKIATLPAEAVVSSFGCGTPLAFSPVKPGDVVLDLGSSAGIDLLLAAKKVGRQDKVIGVDMTDAMSARARNNIRAEGLRNVEVRKGIIEDLPVADGVLDWVISNCVINLSPEKPRVFAEIAQVLKPGGRMLVSDIVAERLPPEIASNRHLYSSCLADAISEKDYLAGLRQAGLVDVEVADRLAYDTVQIADFIGSELKPSACGCCFVPTDALAKKWAPRLAGRIASVKVAARKPAVSARDVLAQGQEHRRAAPGRSAHRASAAHLLRGDVPAVVLHVEEGGCQLRSGHHAVLHRRLEQLRAGHRRGGGDLQPRQRCRPGSGHRAARGGAGDAWLGQSRALARPQVLRRHGGCPMNSVLFLCVASSARSQMAEGLARAMWPSELKVWSAGSRPTSVRREAVQVLAEIGIDISHHRSKSVTEIPPAEVDTVITLCGEESRPRRSKRCSRGTSDEARTALSLRQARSGRMPAPARNLAVGTSNRTIGLHPRRAGRIVERAFCHGLLVGCRETPAAPTDTPSQAPASL
jgi:arsenite methyltransferase